MTQVVKRVPTASIRTAAQGVLDALNPIVIDNHSGSGAGATGLSIFLPDVGSAIPLSYTNLDFPQETGWMGFLQQLVAQGQGTVIYRDWAESNDLFARAYNLRALSQHAQDLNGLSIHSSEDVDWFRFRTVADGVAGDAVSISFTNGIGNLNLYLYDAQNNLLESSQTTGNQEIVSLAGRPVGEYYIKVAGASGATNNYTMTIDASGAAMDWAESNNLTVKATPIQTNTPYVGLNLSNGDVDWYQFAVARLPGQDYLLVSAQGSSALQLALYDANQHPLATSVPTPDGVELVSFDMGAGPYYLTVQGEVPAGYLPYSLEVTQAKQNLDVKMGAVQVVDDQEAVVNYGQVKVNDAPPARTFTVTNASVDPMQLGSLTVPAGFTVVKNLPNTLAVGASDTFIVQMNTAAGGAWSGQVSFEIDGSAENVFNFPVSGAVTANTSIVVGDQAGADAQTLTYWDTDDTAVTVTPKGMNATLLFADNFTFTPGAKIVLGSATGPTHEIVSIEVAGVLTTGTLTINAKGGGDNAVNIQEIGGHGVILATLAAKGLNLTGEAGVAIDMGTGYIGAVTANNILADVLMLQAAAPGAGPAKGLSFALNNIRGAGTDFLLGDAYVKSIKAASWQAGRLNAGFVGSIALSSDFDGDITLSGQDAKGVALGTLSAKTSISTHAITANAGGINSITAGDWSGDVSSLWIKSLSIKANAPAHLEGHFSGNITLTGADLKGIALGALSVAGRANVTKLASQGGITSITAGDWVGGAGDDEGIQAPWIKGLTLKAKPAAGLTGDFSGAVHLSGRMDSTKRIALGTIAVNSITNSQITSEGGSIGTVNVKNAVTGSRIVSYYDLNKLTATVFDNSYAVAGWHVKDEGLGGFLDGTIGSITIKGMKDPLTKAWTAGFTASGIAAGKVGKAVLGFVDTAAAENSTDDFGLFIANTDVGKTSKISVAAWTNYGGAKWSWTPDDADCQLPANPGDFHVKLMNAVPDYWGQT
jgi:hypothetical protein